MRGRWYRVECSAEKLYNYSKVKLENEVTQIEPLAVSRLMCPPQFTRRSIRMHRSNMS